MSSPGVTMNRKVLITIVAIVVGIELLALGRVVFPRQWPGAMPGPGVTLDLIYLFPLIAPVLIGYYATRIFGRILYGTVSDIVIALVGAALIYFPFAHIANQNNFSFSHSDRLNSVIYGLLAAVGALLLLFIVRLIGGKRAQPGIVSTSSGAASAPTGAAPAAATASGSSNSAVMDQLKKLGELHAAGVLNDSEFATKKTELLARL